MRTVLHTSVLIAAGHGYQPIPGELAISAVSLAEIHFGILRATDDQVRADRLQLLIAVERRFDALPVDEAVAISYGRLAAAVVDAGRRPRGRVMDLLIAATAHAHDAALCTPTRLGVGQTFVDEGGGHLHLVRNETAVPAVVSVVQIMPRGLTRRIDAPRPNNCQPSIE